MPAPDADIISGNAGYWVPSSSHPGYFVLVNGSTCSCPAGESVSCRHRVAVRELVAEQNRKAKRPVAPPNVTAMVD